jgi:hypothetical protein
VSFINCASLKPARHDKIGFPIGVGKFDGILHVPCSNLLSSHSSRMDLHSVNALSINIIIPILSLMDLMPKTVGRDSQLKIKFRNPII